MTLDPQAEAWLKNLAAEGVPTLSAMSVSALSVTQARPVHRRLVADAALEPETVVRIDEFVIPGPGGNIPVRVYTPEGSPSFPVLVYFHGGRWALGDLDSVHGALTVLANRAHAVIVSVDYRLAPENPFPAALDDADAVVRWVAANPALIDVDVERIAVGGDDAGANLAAVVALLARDRGGPRLIHQVLITPVTDLAHETASAKENAEGYFLPAELTAALEQQYLGGEGDPSDWRISPLRAPDLSGLPAAHVVTAEYDPLRDEGEAYATRLSDAGVHVTETRYEGQIHGFAANLAGVMDQGRQAIEDLGAELRLVFRRGWRPLLWHSETEGLA